MQLTWEDCQLAALQKMFSAGKTIDTDESTADYIAAMPFAANEAVQRIIAVRPKRSQVEVEAKPSEEEQSFDLQEIAYDFKNTGPLEVYSMTEGGAPVRLDACRVVAGRYLVIPPVSKAVTIIFCYEPTVPLISYATKPGFPLPVDDDAAVLVPIYIAGELYKEDDLGISTYYMNEFEDGLALLKPKDTGSIANSFYSESGW